jgi:hypothetical protein
MEARRRSVPFLSPRSRRPSRVVLEDTAQSFSTLDGAGHIELVALSRRIEGETEPPNLATETNAGRGIFPARNPQSPVRIRRGPTAKTPRNRGDFSGCVGVRAGSLCNSRLNGGGGSLERTRLCCRFPDLQGKCREILRDWARLADPSAEIPKPFRSRSDRFPVIKNRELVSTSREIPASETALQAEATEPSHPPLSVGAR